jgi:polyhydroxybutyrate depolymerase
MRGLRIAALVLIGLLALLLIPLLSSFFAGRHSLSWADGSRSFHVYVPSGYDPAQPAPLLLVYHGGGGFGWWMQEISGFNALAERAGFIVAYPDGLGGRWADGSPTAVDDVAFTAALIDHLSAQYHLDSRRVYAVGFASGGALALRLGCELSDRIAAVAAVSATLAETVRESCQPARPLPLLLMHGTADTELPLDGRPGLASIPAALLTWVSLAGCDPLPLVETIDPAADETRVRLEMYIGCDDPTLEIRYYAIDGGGHRWPGSHSIWQFGLPGRTTQDIDASAVIWEFFASRARAGF